MILEKDEQSPKRIFSRNYSIGGMTIVVASDSPITDRTFKKETNAFSTATCEKDRVSLHHHFSLPLTSSYENHDLIYNSPPWMIYKHGNCWTYVETETKGDNFLPIRVATFNEDHSLGKIYHHSDIFFQHGDNESLTLFPTDQILLSKLLAYRQGCIFHAAGMVINQQAFLFVGHSGAGKSTLVTMLRPEGEILCDDRIIVRYFPEGWRAYGTWSHGDVPDVSSASAPLRAILLLEQAAENRLIPLIDRREIVRRLPFFIVKPLVTADWWEKTLDLVGMLAREVPVFRLQFDRSGRVIDVLRALL